MAIMLPQMTVSISTKQRKQTVRYDQCPFMNDLVLSTKDSEEQIITNVELIFDLKAAGIKVFLVLAWILRNRLIRMNTIVLDKAVLKMFLASQDKKLALSPTTFFRGVAELEKAGIIAKQNHRAWYFINPNLVFSDKHIVFKSNRQLGYDISRSKGRVSRLLSSLYDCGFIVMRDSANYKRYPIRNHSDGIVTACGIDLRILVARYHELKQKQTKLWKLMIKRRKLCIILGDWCVRLKPLTLKWK